jgi:hypothetical protein
LTTLISVRLSTRDFAEEAAAIVEGIVTTILGGEAMSITELTIVE